MTQADFSAKWDKRFKDNVDFIISEADLREFKDDCLLVFGAGANAGASAQLLGFDPATGEFLVLLSPSAPKTESSYVLAEYAAPPGAGYALRPLPAGAGLASRVLRVPVSARNKTLCVLDAAGEPVPLTVLEIKAEEDERFTLLSTTDPALPVSAVRGLIDWHYEESNPTLPWTLKPGRSVMFTRSRQLVLDAGVQEGDVFSIYINPLSTVSRVELAYGGGIDEQPKKRYLPGTSIVLRYTLIPDYTDANGTLIQAHYGLRTVQQTTLTAANFRGPYSTTAYYVPGDLVVYQGALYLRLVEGGNENPFAPAKWAGGGGAPAADGKLPLTTTRTAAYTLALADAGCLVPVSSANAIVITLPANADVALPVGSTGFIRRLGTGAVTLAPGTNVQFLPPGVGTALDDYGEVAWHKTDQDTYWLKGDLL